MSELHNMSLDQAAQTNADGWLISTIGALKGSFKKGAAWQKEQDKELINLARQLLIAFNNRYPNTEQLLVGYTNEEILSKFHSSIYTHYGI